jgi:hypothetical protein
VSEPTSQRSRVIKTRQTKVGKEKFPKAGTGIRPGTTRPKPPLTTCAGDQTGAQTQTGLHGRGGGETPLGCACTCDATGLLQLTGVYLSAGGGPYSAGGS